MIEYLQATNFGAHIRKWKLRHNKGQPLFDDRNRNDLEIEAHAIGR